MTTLANKKLAVLIDADNAPADIIDRLLEEVAKIETVARDTIATDMEYIAQSYGFEDADIEELVAPRDW